MALHNLEVGRGGRCVCRRGRRWLAWQRGGGWRDLWTRVERRDAGALVVVYGGADGYGQRDSADDAGGFVVVFVVVVVVVVGVEGFSGVGAVRDAVAATVVVVGGIGCVVFVEKRGQR